MWYNIDIMNQTKMTPKDFFLHLGATIALYISVGALINLSFSIINYYFPDQLAGYFYGNSVAFPISILVVLVPVLYILGWMIRKDIMIAPEKKDMWIRRWRIDITLFLTAAILIGDLITIINTYLNGEISIRFFYKFLVILVVLGIVFAYYLLERLDKNTKMRSVLSYVGVVLVIAAVVGGFITVGSPTKQRNLKFDNQRTSDLQNVQWQIVSHWQQKEKLPATLDELKDPISGVVIPTDPETKANYEYSVKGTNSFELCSTFALKSEDNKGRGEFGYGGGVYRDMAYPSSIGDDNWTHEAGKVCFDRTIDPEKYPVIKR
jgi:hypothetical protein